MNGGRLTIWIDGREALPVRAIPYVTEWRYSPHVVAESLALATAAPFGKLRNLVAYHRPAGKPLPVIASNWTAVIAEVEGSEPELRGQRLGVDAMHDCAAIHPLRKVAAALKLPGGVFVWLDEFRRELESDRKREADGKHTPDDVPVTLAPMIDADTRLDAGTWAAMLEGFEDCPRRGPDADRVMIGYADFVKICRVDDPKNFGRFRVEDNGMYVDRPDVDAMLTPEEQAAVTRHSNGQDDKPALSLPCTLGQLRAFLPELGMTGYIDEEVVDALLDERERCERERYIAGWHDPQIDEKLYWELPSILPHHAAMLLCWFDPEDDKRDPTIESSNETGPQDFHKLLLLFEAMERAEQKPRTLPQWLAAARDKGLKHHSWIDAYALAQIEGSPADAGSKGDAVKVGAGGTAEISGIPGRLPRVAIGRLAVTVAWQIEHESNRAATADKVIERLQAWATDGEHPDILLRAVPRKRAVIWMTKRKGLEKDYDVGACGKTLDEWRKSRA